MKMIGHNNNGIDAKAFSLFYVSKSCAQDVNPVHQLTIIFPFRKVHGKNQVRFLKKTGGNSSLIAFVRDYAPPYVGGIL